MTLINNNTYLQKYSPLGVDRQVPPFLHGEGEHETKPEEEENITLACYNMSTNCYLWLRLR